MISHKKINTKKKPFISKTCFKEPNSATLKLKSRQSKENAHITPKIISNYDENPSEKSW